MTRIAVSRTMAVGHEAVWKAIADLGSHPKWMRDARSIEFTTEQKAGAGTRMVVQTRLGPLRILDVMRVVGWDEGRSVEVVHEGLVRGRGQLTAWPDGDSTHVTWKETLTFPWWLGGGLTAWMARPVLEAVWRGNLRRLEESLSSP